MVLTLPVALFGNAISQVFFQRTAEVKHEGMDALSHLVEKVDFYLIKLGLFPMLVLILIGYDIFFVVFGSKWGEAGFYSQILAPLVFSVFITSPLTSLFLVLEKQHQSLVINIITEISRIGAFTLGALSGNAVYAIILFSLVGTINNLAINFWLIRLVHISVSQIMTFFSQNVADCLPFVGIIFIIKWYFNSNPLKVFLPSLLIVLVYYFFMLRKDKELLAFLRSRSDH
jgi:O-antigen/teichoic acid export membrane protein